MPSCLKFYFFAKRFFFLNGYLIEKLKNVWVTAHVFWNQPSSLLSLVFGIKKSSSYICRSAGATMWSTLISCCQVFREK